MATPSAPSRLTISGFGSLDVARELVQWFQQEIPNLVTDTIANEVTSDPNTGVALPLHAP